MQNQQQLTQEQQEAIQKEITSTMGELFFDNRQMRKEINALKETIQKLQAELNKE